MSATLSKSLFQGSPRSVATHALRRQILSGSLTAGDRLPPEEKLAKEFGVSRGTLRHALDALQGEGLVERRRNLGCVVATRQRHDGSLMGRTITLISNLTGGARGNLFTGHLASINSGILDTVQAQGLNFLLIHSNLEVEETVNRLLIERPFGVAISSHIGDPQKGAMLVGRLRDAKLPVVIHSNDAAFAQVDRVNSDHEQGAADMVRALIAAGRRRILRVWPSSPSAWWVMAHDRGYDAAIRESGIEPIAPLYVKGLLERDEHSRENFDIRVRQIAGFLLEQHRLHAMDAIMVVTDCEVPMVAAACRLIGITPGRDVAICGYDNYWELAPERQWEPTPPFATVDKQNHLIGEELVGLLLDRASGKLGDAACMRTVPQRLVRLDAAS